MKKALASGVMLLSVATAGNAFAALTLNIDTVYSGLKIPSSGSLTAVFTQINTDTVKLEVANNLAPGAFASGLYFNFNATKDLGSLKFYTDSGLSNSATNVVTSRYDGTNKETPKNNNADGGGYFDIVFSLPTAENTNRFDNGEILTYYINSSGILESDFTGTFSEKSNHGNLYAAAHVQSLSGGDSAWVGATPTPIPAAAWLLGSGVLGMIGFRRKKTA